jgi:hypothetical protein
MILKPIGHIPSSNVSNVWTIDDRTGGYNYKEIAYREVRKL